MGKMDRVEDHERSSIVLGHSSKDLLSFHLLFYKVLEHSPHREKHTRYHPDLYAPFLPPLLTVPRNPHASYHQTMCRHPATILPPDLIVQYGQCRPWQTVTLTLGLSETVCNTTLVAGLRRHWDWMLVGDGRRPFLLGTTRCRAQACIGTLWVTAGRASYLS